MKSAFASTAATLLFAASTVAQLTINTPLSVVVCQPLLITWSGGTPPYFLSVLPGNQPTAPALLDFGTQTGTSLTWNVNITAGTSLGMNLRDSTGAVAQSGVFTVQSSPNTACLTATPAPGGSSTSGSSASGSSASTPPANTTPTPATTPATTPLTTPATTPSTTPANTPSSSGSGSAAKPATTSSSAVSAHNLSFGLAGIIGAVVALVV